MQVDHRRVADGRRFVPAADGADAAVLDQHPRFGARLGPQAVDQRRVLQQCAHVNRAWRPTP